LRSLRFRLRRLQSIDDGIDAAGEDYIRRIAVVEIDRAQAGLGKLRGRRELDPGILGCVLAHRFHPKLVHFGRPLLPILRRPRVVVRTIVHRVGIGDGHQVLRFYVRLKEEGLYGHSDARPSPGRKFYFSNLQGLRENSSLVSGTTIPGMPQIEEIPYSTGTCSFVLAPGSGITQTDIKFYAFNYDAAAPDFTIPAGMPANQESVSPREKIDVALFSLHPGKYRISLNGLTKNIYYDPVLAREDIAGVVELYLHLPASHENALLDDSGRVQEKQFALFLPGKPMQWKDNMDRKPESGQAGKDIHLPATRNVMVLKKLWTRKDKTG